MTNEIPSDNDVVVALERLGGSATAIKLCRRLMEDGHPEWQCQLAIQRAAERGKIDVRDDWTLTTAREAVAA